MIDREKFAELLLNTQAKFLLTKGRHLTSVDRSSKPVDLYSLGKRFYEIIYNSYKEKKVISIDEVNAENVMHSYFFNNT